MLTHSKELKAQLSELSEFGGTNFGKKFFSNTKSTDYLNNAPIEETINFATPPIAANEHFSLQTGDQRGATSTQTRHPIIDQTPPTTMMGALENEWIDFKVIITYYVCGKIVKSIIFFLRLNLINPIQHQKWNSDGGKISSRIGSQYPYIIRTTSLGAPISFSK